MTEHGEPLIEVTLPRAQIEAIYEVTIAKAVILESAEDVAMCGMGSRRYRLAADALRKALDQSPPPKEGR